MNSLEPEEKNLLDSVENQEWHSVAKLSEAVENYREFAQNHINRLADVPISITLDPDVAEVFKTSELVNQILRVIMKKTLSVSLEETESGTISLILTPEFIEVIQKAQVRL
ncbi:hypothetical protein [Kamptonema sp. UHCC 0994]|uniref:hypothetical protein n=1 Tax=Kamptonema sp. UHCC 0994 TaxID=3031329 RepID=UPI0023B9BBA7|nr:hypothetical protein [Kamptonema sp. UHCC 0994]MDF0552498.1 hypothetical protein [Kamptonema sp. UHCC 0994]